MPQNEFTGKAAHPNVKARVLPHSDEAEQAVLGCALIDGDSGGDAVLAIINELKTEDFYSPAHAEIFRAMQNLSFKDKPIDFVTLVNEVEEMGVTEKVGGLSYITGLTTMVPSAGNFRHYLNIVKKTSLLRSLIAASQRVMDCAYAEDAEDDALSLAEREIYALGERRERSALVDINVAIGEAIRIMDEKQRNPLDTSAVPMPFADLNDMLGGFHKSDLVVIGARPGEGKTSLGMNFVSHAALDKSRRTPAGKVDPFRCAVFSLEMSAEQLATRLLCSVAKVSMENVKSGKRTAQEVVRIMEAQKRLSEAKIFIDDSSLTTPIEVLNKCRRLKREQGLDLVLVDYLQLMTSGKRVESRQQEVSDITRTMKIAAKELDVPIILLSQLSRDITKRDDKKPQMSDLRESGAIEQDADIIIFLYRDHDPNDLTIDENTRTKCELIVAKHRNGRTGSVTVRWHGEYTTFTDLNEYDPTAALAKREPREETHFTGVNDAAPANEDDFFDPADLAPPPEAPAEKNGGGGKSGETKSGFTDPFDAPVKGDDDII